MWLAQDTIILALRNPSTSRVVFGIAKPWQEGSGPGSLNDIPGFKEIVSDQELADFRAVIPVGGVRNKYRVIGVGSPGLVSFDQIDENFRDYVRSATTQLNELDIWDVIVPGAGEIRVVFLGDLVLVKPAQTSDSQRKAENAMFQLLNKMALDEKKGIRKVLLEGCTRTASTLQVARHEPFSEQSRKELRNAAIGKITGAHGEAEDEFIVTNSGWVNRALRFDVQPVPTSESDFKVTAVVGEEEQSILNQRELELQPCEMARISIEPQDWYYKFPTLVDFHYDENGTTLSAHVPDPALNWFLILSGVAASAIVGLLIWLLLQFIPVRRQPKKLWGELIGPKIDGLVTPKTYVSRTPSPRLSQLKFLKKAGTEPSPRDASEPLIAEPLNRPIAHDHNRAAESEVDLKTQKMLNETRMRLSELEYRLKDAELEDKRWRHLLKELGDSPEAILQSWHDLNKRHKDLRQQALQIAPPAMDERILRARLISLGIKKVGEQLRHLEATDSHYATLFTGTGLELTPLACDLVAAATSSEATLTFELTKQRLMKIETPELEKIHPLKTFFRELMSNKYPALLGMLRLWQVLEVYCRDSDDRSAATLHTHSEGYRRTCLQVLSDFESLGVHFQKIRFLQDPHDERLIFNEAASIPPLQANAKLFALIKTRLHSNSYPPPWKTVADVAFWGFECELNPSMNCQSQLWLWRSLSFA